MTKNTNNSNSGETAPVRERVSNESFTDTASDSFSRKHESNNITSHFARPSKHGSDSSDDNKKK